MKRLFVAIIAVQLVFPPTVSFAQEVVSAPETPQDIPVYLYVSQTGDILGVVPITDHVFLGCATQIPSPTEVENSVETAPVPDCALWNASTGAVMAIAEGGAGEASRAFIGKDYDTDTGLSQLEARYYKGEVGRFISQDPVSWSLPKDLLADPQQLNSYSYGRNNPVVFKDPTGLLSIYVHGAFINGRDAQILQSQVIDNSENKELFSWMENQFGEPVTTYGWSGVHNNSEFYIEGVQLANMINHYAFKEGDKLNIVAHSDGGNVVFNATQSLNRKVDTLITLGTPVKTGNQSNMKTIDKSGFITVSANQDPVQKIGSSLSNFLVPRLGSNARVVPSATNIILSGHKKNTQVHSELRSSPSLWTSMVSALLGLSKK